MTAFPVFALHLSSVHFFRPLFSVSLPAFLPFGSKISMPPNSASTSSQQPPSLLPRKSSESLILHQSPHNIAPEINIETNPVGPPLILCLTSSFLRITPSNPTLPNNHNAITRRQQRLRPPHLLPLLKHHLPDPNTNPTRNDGMMIPQEAVPPPLLYFSIQVSKTIAKDETNKQNHILDQK